MDTPIVSLYKTLENGAEDQSFLEETTNQIIVPIRSKNRDKILKAIDQYQSTAFKEELEMDRNH